MKYGIAYTHDGAPPHSGRIVNWKQNDKFEDETWDSRAEALEACELDGWAGYVCEYPSGAR